MTQDAPELQAITSALGSEASQSEREMVRRAFEWAQERHAGRTRKDGSTVFEHVLAVARNVLEPGERDPELIAAALLHDTVENHCATVPEIADHFGVRVAALVEAVTNAPGTDASAAVERALQAGPDALLLRIADRLDGVRRSPRRPEPGRTKFLAETRAVHLRVAERHLPALAARLREALDSAG